MSANDTVPLENWKPGTKNICIESSDYRARAGKKSQVHAQVVVAGNQSRIVFADCYTVWVRIFPHFATNLHFSTLNSKPSSKFKFSMFL